MKFGMVVQANGVVGVGVAKDVPAVSAVMTALEQVEGFVTRGRVADDGVGIGLPVVARGETFDGSVGWGGLWGTLWRFDGLPGGLALAGRSAAARSAPIATVQAVGAAVHAPWRGQRRRAVRAFGRSQHGREEQGQFGRSELPGGQRKAGQDGAMMRRRRRDIGGGGHGGVHGRKMVVSLRVGWGGVG